MYIFGMLERIFHFCMVLKLIFSVLFFAYSVLLYAQDACDIKEFQRYRFGTIYSYIVSNNSDAPDKLGQLKHTVFEKHDSRLSGLAFLTNLCRLESSVDYYFTYGKLDQISFHDRCIAIGINEKGNECTTQTLKEFMSLRNNLTELFGEPAQCIGCEVCVTKPIDIPNYYSKLFEDDLVKAAILHPDNSSICSYWYDYTNDSDVQLLYNIELGWSLMLKKKID